MRLKDLKSGMEVKMRGGSTWFVLRDRLVMKNFQNSIPKHLYTDELIYKDRENENLDIVSVISENGVILWIRDEVDWSKVPINTKVIVSDCGEHWLEGYFYSYAIGNKNNTIYTFNEPVTPYNLYSNKEVGWNFAKLYDEENASKYNIEYKEVFENEEI